MRLTAVFATLAVLVAPSVVAASDNGTTIENSTTTVTRTVLQATATSTVVRSSSSATQASTYVKPSRSAASAAVATPSGSGSTIPGNYMGAASTEQNNLVVMALAGAAAVAFGL